MGEKELIVTVGMLKEQLEQYPEDATVEFVDDIEIHYTPAVTSFDPEQNLLAIASG